MVQDKQGRQPKYLSRTHTRPISDGTHTEEMESSCNGAHLDGFFNHDSSQRQSLEPSAAQHHQGFLNDGQLVLEIACIRDALLHGRLACVLRPDKRVDEDLDAVLEIVLNIK